MSTSLPGVNMTEADMRGAAPICVVGNDLIENLLPGVDPVGKEIRWNNNPCEVVGAGKKQGSALGTSLDNWIIGPPHHLQKELRQSAGFPARHLARRLCCENSRKRG